MFEEVITQELKRITNLAEIPLEVPPNQEMGEFAFPCFILSKSLKKKPAEIAHDIVLQWNTNIHEVQRVEAIGPYVNFFLNRDKFARNVLNDIYKRKKEYGKGGESGTVIVEYSQTNTHKAVHVGHTRNICLGEAICRVLEKSGKTVIRVNFQGDIGPHVAKCVWGYLNLDEEEPASHKGTWLGKIYALASAQAKESKEVELAIREINNKLYARDKDLLEVWKKTRQYCLDDFDEFYVDFGVEFDRLYFESEVEGPGKSYVTTLLKKGIAIESEGAIIMDFEKEKLGVFVLLTSEGNALYSTKDLGLAELKQKEFEFDTSIHVVGSEQKLHFKQVFKTLGIAGSSMALKSVHIPYGLVLLPEGKMSSRDGTMVLHNDLVEKLLEGATHEIVSRHKLSEDEVIQRARTIAFGALKFGMINRDNNKDLVFDWKSALDFEGETGPYVQYAHARVCSILRKAAGFVDVDYTLLGEKEHYIIRVLSQFPIVVSESALHYKPSLICRYLLDLSQMVNSYYHDVPILTSEEPLRNARLKMLHGVKQVIHNGLHLLGIGAPEEM